MKKLVLVPAMSLMAAFGGGGGEEAGGAATDSMGAGRTTGGPTGTGTTP